MNGRPHVLIVAGSDSSGGAGLARDIATVSRFGVVASLAITAVTVQTHSAVLAQQPVGGSLVAGQMQAAMTANPITAVKIGMMATAENVGAIAEVLAANPAAPAVLDPVIASSSGARLLTDEALELLKRRLLRHCALITPNLPELAMLTEHAVARSEAEIALQAKLLLERGCRQVLVKGGHANGPQSIDTLFSENPPLHFASRRRPVTVRGSGCMLSSAIAANLALGNDMRAAITAAKAFVDAAFDDHAGAGLEFERG